MNVKNIFEIYDLLASEMRNPNNILSLLPDIYTDTVESMYSNCKSTTMEDLLQLTKKEFKDWHKECLIPEIKNVPDIIEMPIKMCKISTTSNNNILPYNIVNNYLVTINFRDILNTYLHHCNRNNNNGSIFENDPIIPDIYELIIYNDNKSIKSWEFPSFLKNLAIANVYEPKKLLNILHIKVNYSNNTTESFLIEDFFTTFSAIVDIFISKDFLKKHIQFDTSDIDIEVSTNVCKHIISFLEAYTLLMATYEKLTGESDNGKMAELVNNILLDELKFYFKIIRYTDILKDNTFNPIKQIYAMQLQKVNIQTLQGIENRYAMLSGLLK